MTDELQSILVEDFTVQWPGFRLQRIALNQHMPRVEKLSSHRHSFHQLLIYLRGRGTQHLEDSMIDVERGSLLFIEAGKRHSFQKSGTIRPVCLAVDFCADNHPEWSMETSLAKAELSKIERLLVKINEHESLPGKDSIPLVSLLLQLLATMREGMERQHSCPQVRPIQFAVESVISRESYEILTPRIIAARLGRTLDHLNRQLGDECGTTVGRLLSRKKVERAGELLLLPGYSIGEVGSEIGMHDQNYFTRWFRKETGHTPTRWREAMKNQSA